MSDGNGTMSLEQFFDHVDDVQEQMRARGIVTVYFQHDTLTPGNVRATWEDHPVAELPKVGDVLVLPHAGFYGSPGHWRVKDVEILASGAGALVTMTDLEEKPRRELPDGSYLEIARWDHTRPGFHTGMTPDISVIARTPNDGGRWEFAVEGVEIHGEVFPRVCLFHDGWKAFEEIPDFFAALTSNQPGSLEEVTALLLQLGAVWADGHQ